MNTIISFSLLVAGVVDSILKRSVKSHKQSRISRHDVGSKSMRDGDVEVEIVSLLLVNVVLFVNHSKVCRKSFRIESDRPGFNPSSGQNKNRLLFMAITSVC